MGDYVLYVRVMPAEEVGDEEFVEDELTDNETDADAAEEETEG